MYKDYVEKFLSLRKRFETEGKSFCDTDIFFDILHESFVKGLESAPAQIYGSWDEHANLCGKLSPVYLEHDREIPGDIAPKKDILISSWMSMGSYFRKEHAEFLWFIEKERLLLGGISTDICLSPNEKNFKDRALAALKRGDRKKAFYLFSEALSCFPGDFTLYADIAFLYLNDKLDIKEARVNFETACKVITQKNTFIYCLLRLVVSMVHSFEGNFINAYAITQDLMVRFKGEGEVEYQHAINAFNIDKMEEGFYYLKRSCHDNINYAMKAYEELSGSLYIDGMEHMFDEIVSVEKNKFYTLRQSVEAALNEARALGVNDWGKGLIGSIKSDLDTINVLGNSKAYIDIVAAKFFIAKIPDIIISKARDILLEKVRQKLEENNDFIRMKMDEIHEKISERKNYNLIGIPLVALTTTVFFVFLGMQKGLLFGFAFSMTFASVLCVAIVFNTLNIKKLRIKLDIEVGILKGDSARIVASHRKEIQTFKVGIKNTVIV